MSDLSLIEHLKSRISELEQQTRELQYRLDQVTTLHSFEHETPDGPVLCWLDIPNKSTGQPELVCAGLMSTRSFPGIKYFSRLPTFRNAPWKNSPTDPSSPSNPGGAVTSTAAQVRADGTPTQGPQGAHSPAGAAGAGGAPAVVPAPSPGVQSRRYATQAPPDWPVIVNGVAVAPFDPPRYTEAEIAVGWERVLSQAKPGAKQFNVPVEALWPELPKVEREWLFEVGDRDGVPYFGLWDNWGNHAEVQLVVASRSHAPLIKLIREYLETNGEEVVPEVTP